MTFHCEQKDHGVRDEVEVALGQDFDLGHAVTSVCILHLDKPQPEQFMGFTA